MKAVGVGICVLATFAVAAFGGTTEWARAILEIGAGGLVLLWGLQALRQKRAEIQGNWLYVPLLGLLVLASLELIFGTSAYPFSTKTELLQWGAFALLFFLAVQWLHSAEAASEFAWFLVSLGFCVSLLGIAQHFTAGGRPYWVVPMESGGGPFGPFVDRDHFAGFVELTVPPGLAMLIFGACRKEKVVLLTLLSILPIGALVLAGSRGGALSLLAEVAVLLLLSRLFNTRVRRLPESGLAVLAAGVLVIWLGGAQTLQRFRELRFSEITRDQRFIMYRDTWRIFLGHPWAGTGLGTLAIVYPQTESQYNQPGVDHAHNDYLELLADAGLVGGVLGLGFVALLYGQGLLNLRRAASSRERALYAGSLASCSGLLVHSLVDFNLHIPSNALLFLLVCAMATTERKSPAGPIAGKLKRRKYRERTDGETHQAGDLVTRQPTWRGRLAGRLAAQALPRDLPRQNMNTPARSP